MGWVRLDTYSVMIVFDKFKGLSKTQGEDIIKWSNNEADKLNEKFNSLFNDLDRNKFTGDSLITDYPLGISMLRIVNVSAGFPFSYGLLITFKSKESGSPYSTQMFHDVVNRKLYLRSVTGSGQWNEWVQT